MFKKLFIVLILLIIGMFLPARSQAHNALPEGFAKEAVVQGLNYPVGAAQAPDGRIFMLEKGGSVRVFKNGSLLSTPFATLPVATNGEQGLLGIAFDGNFASNRYVYLMYVNSSPLELRISRFVANGDTVLPGSETVLFRTTQALNQNHLGGTVRYGPDGKLWFSIGNNAVNNNSQDLSNPFGKILRINTDGSIPSDNPFYSHKGENGAIWAYGFRNPFRFNFSGGQLIVGDVGEGSFEEINNVVKGGNYGWPKCEGTCSNGYVNPMFEYGHGGGSASVTGGVFVPTSSTFPQAYQKIYVYGDYAVGFLRFLKFDQNGNFVSDNLLDDHAGPVVDILNGQDGSLYFITLGDQFFSPNSGTLSKISYEGANVKPEAVVHADPIAGLAPLKVKFSSAGSNDPNGGTLTYSWNFGDGATSTEADPTHTYSQNGTYEAKLTVNNGKSTNEAKVTINVGKELPNPSIITPAENSKYNAGNTISYSGTATDPKDGELPASAFKWSILFHHQTHVHPFIESVEGVKSGTFTIPQTGEPSAETSYEIILTVTNSSGLSKTVSRTIQPNVVKMTFTTQPVSGLTFTLDGIPRTAPYTVDSVVGYKHVVDVPSFQAKGDFNYTFSAWSDGQPQNHTITTLATDATYTAGFHEVAAGKGRVYFRIHELDGNGNLTNKFVNGATAKLTDPSGAIEYQTTTSKKVNNEDGWVFFDNVPSGDYATLSYKAGATGGWKQTNCAGAGTSQGATIKNNNTENFIAAWQSTIPVVANETTWCRDHGLKIVNTGAVALRVNLMTIDPNNPDNYLIAAYINGAKVKLTDTSGNTIIQTTVSTTAPNGQEGWAYIGNIPAGTYGVLAYKDGLEGFWKMTNCAGAFNANSSIKNTATENNVAAWNNQITITAGVTNYCYDLGLQGAGHIRYRVREFDNDNFWTGKFVNGATAKLTDTTGATILQTATSKVLNGEDGWVEFNNVKAGNYGIMTYMTNSTGSWKQTNCEAGGTTTDATIQNANSDNLVAAWQKDVQVTSNKITWCKDVGVKSNAEIGHVFFRVREVDPTGSESGRFVNDAIAKLTDSAGNTVIQTSSSKKIGGQDGWIQFTKIPAGTYGIMVYKNGMKGIWKQTNCEKGGTTTDATIKNGNTEDHDAAWANDVIIQNNKITWCKDLGLTPIQPTTPAQAQVKQDPTPTATATPTMVDLTQTPTPTPSDIPATPTPTAVISPRPEDNQASPSAN